MEYHFRDEVINIKKAPMGEIFSLAKEHAKESDKIINFASGYPNTDVLPYGLLESYVTKALEEGGSDILQYGPYLGYLPLREQLKKFANAKGNVCSEEDNIIITYGSAEGIFLAINVLVNKMDKVIIENPSYVNAIKLFELSSANIHTVKQDSDGVNLEELENAMSSGAKVYYTIPNFCNPSGVTMSEEKRKAVYDMAVRHNVIIIEDDAYGELIYRGNRKKSIKEFDNDGKVIYLSTMSKILAPALRIGYVIANKEIINKMAIIKGVSTNGVSSILQYALSKMLEQEDINLTIEAVKKSNAEKMIKMEKCMDKYFPKEVSHSTPDGGMYIWVTMPKYVDVDAFCRECAASLHIPITPGSGFCTKDADKCTSMRFNFVKESLEDIEYGIKRVGELMRKFIC